MNQVDERYDHVHFIAYFEDPSMPGSGKVDFPLSPTPDDPSVEHLLIWDSTSVGDLLIDTGFIAKDVDGFATLATSIPSPPFLPGYVIVIQALLADRCPPGTTCDPTDPPSDPGRIPFALTNAQDLTVTM